MQRRLQPIAHNLGKKEAQDHYGTLLVGPVVKTLPSNAEDMGLIPGGGTKIPHAGGQLSCTLQQ